jgi:MerR family transcriptional regulator, copper efflux regulator
MNIKEAEAATGLPAKTIRYYEEIGLVSPLRAANGYRAFRPRDIETLRFLANARSLGFSTRDCRALLDLRQDDKRASADVKRIAQGHLDEIDHKIARLETLRAQLAYMVQSCAGDARPDCAILDGIAQEEPLNAHPVPSDPPSGPSGGARQCL